MNNNEPSVTPPTDVIISQYENLLHQSIATKTLQAAKEKKPPTLTNEEMAFLTKKAVTESPIAQMEVITPSPTITLKKGKTELNIKNAVDILKKMEERHPISSPQKVLGNSQLEKDDENVLDETLTVTGLDVIIDELENELAEEERELGEVEPDLKEKFKRHVNFPTHKVSQEVASKVAADESKFNPMNTNTPVNTVNKNAYEIRADILGMALNWVRYQMDMAVYLRGEEKIPLSIPSNLEVLDTVKEFYRFVDNKR